MHNVKLKSSERRQLNSLLIVKKLSHFLSREKTSYRNTILQIFTNANAFESLFIKSVKKVTRRCSEVRTDSHITNRQNNPTAETSAKKPKHLHSHPTSHFLPHP